MRITAAQRTENENRIRAAMDRLLHGDIPPSGTCGIKTLARESAADRTAFHGTRPCAHLREEFEHRLRSLHAIGEIADPRDAQVERLKTEVTKPKARLARADGTVEQLTDFRAQALARFAAQHEEVIHLRATAPAASRVNRLSAARSTSIGSGS
ncbi:hypothetical protein HUT16_30510 [Kitasatospora sp. NA04385]|uniref:hypothetical protein n=1 Tax=Kitasatospora sp. NA04385 TaxID=2742135 RepID=UPI0015923D11|nr:hypothetical protein [Kitasatospora sp. NA04385]QKW22850.1 hypothetical protein HUT16_30510 [Kitasatospora sp. NA04385]